MRRDQLSGPAENGRSVSQLFRDIVGEVQEIFRAELRLANAEIKQQLSASAKASVALAGGLIAGLYALLFLLLALACGLAEATGSWWLGALIVGAALAVLTGILVMVGLHRLRAVHAPQRTLRTVKENLTWQKHPQT